MAETITIKFEDEGPRSLSPSPPAPTGLGGPTPFLPVASGPGGGFSTGAVANDLAAKARDQALAAGRIMQDAYKRASDDAVQRIAQGINLGVRVISSSFEIAAQRIAFAAQKSAAIISGNLQQAKVIEKEEQKELASSIGSLVGTITGFVVGGPIGSRILGGIGGRLLGALAGSALLGPDLGRFFGSLLKPSVEAQKKFQTEMEQFRARTQDLGRYDQPIASQLAIGQVQQQRRDIAEAQILSPLFRDVERRQQELDRINQMVEVLTKQGQASQQLAALDKEILDSQKRLEAAMKGATEETRKLVRELEKAAKTPLEQLIDRGGFTKPDERARITDEQLALRPAERARLNAPIIGERER